MFDIEPSESKNLSGGYCQAFQEKRGDSGWMDYSERTDVGSTNWTGAKVDGTPITNSDKLTSGTDITVNLHVYRALKSSDTSYGGYYWLGFKKVTGKWGY